MHHIAGPEISARNTARCAHGLQHLYLFAPILIYVVATAVALLVLYGVIRIAVSRGPRDHQLWMERNRPQGPGIGRS